MFEIRKIAFGDWDAYRLSSLDGDQELCAVPGLGSCLRNLSLGGWAILDACATPKDMAINRWAKSALLYPFPNRLSQGQYEWEGQRYQFPINDVPANNALHGFGMQQPMEVIAAEADEAQARLRCQFDYAGELPYYPFPFQFEVEFILGEGSLEVELSVRNTGSQALPFGMGWHPYFRLTPKVDELILQMPPCDLVGVNAEMIPRASATLTIPLPSRSASARKCSIMPLRCTKRKAGLPSTSATRAMGSTIGRSAARAASPLYSSSLRPTAAR
jgi:aldose 1-epimerase